LTNKVQSPGETQAPARSVCDRKRPKSYIALAGVTPRLSFVALLSITPQLRIYDQIKHIAVGVAVRLIVLSQGPW
jgi:hypothetical protein